MNTKPITESSDPVLAGSLLALKRAAKRARKIAKQTGTRLIVATGKNTGWPSDRTDKR